MGAWTLLTTQAHSGSGARDLGVNVGSGARNSIGSLALLIVPYSTDSEGAVAAARRIENDGSMAWEVPLPSDARAIDLREDGSAVVAGGDPAWLIEIDALGSATPMMPIVGWSAGLVGLAAADEVFLLGVDAAHVPILARVDGDTVAWLVEAPGELPTQMQDMAIDADGATVVIAGWNGSDVVVVAHESDIAEKWRWQQFGGSFSFRPVLSHSDDGWVVATGTPPTVHFLDSNGLSKGLVELPEVSAGWGQITALMPRGPSVWLTLAQNSEGVNDLPATDLVSVQLDTTPCCSVHVFDVAQGHYPALLTSDGIGNASLIGDRCEGITCAVAQSGVAQR